jgi:hypothetical protein
VKREGRLALSWQEVLDGPGAAGAPPERHFVPTPGLHSARHVPCARVTMDGHADPLAADAPAGRLAAIPAGKPNSRGMA